MKIQQKKKFLYYVSIPILILLVYVLFPDYFFPGRKQPILAQSKEFGSPSRLRNHVSFRNVTLFKTCTFLNELRNVDFLDQKVSKSLCQGVQAYHLQTDGGYPLCELSQSLNPYLQATIVQGSVRAFMYNADGALIPMYVYPSEDLISRSIIKSHNWENDEAKVITGMAVRIPNTTFADVGCNIGVYTLMAASRGLRTVSMDANIRNLLRLRASLIENRVAFSNSSLVWNYISSTKGKLELLGFPSDCNVGGTSGGITSLTDTVPVMTMSADKLVPLILTRNVVMKIDIEGGEAVFFKTADRIFNDFNVVAVQMEWIPPKFGGMERHEFLVKFFTDRAYVPFRYASSRIPFLSAGLQRLNVNDSRNWNIVSGINFMNVYWIKPFYVNELTGQVN